MNSTELTIGSWNSLAEVRLEQIVSGRDISYNHIILPTVFSMLPDSRVGSVLDVGCGVGVLAASLADRAHSVLGIDISTESINLAASTFCKPNLEYKCISLSKLVTIENSTFDIIVANMFLMNVPDLDAQISNMFAKMHPESLLIFGIIHPCFWPRYRNYEHESWFSYIKERSVSQDFNISLEKTGRPTMHYHRPLHIYVNAINNAGLRLLCLREPMPNEDVESMYPKKWKYPRFLFGCATPNSNTNIDQHIRKGA